MRSRPVLPLRKTRIAAKTSKKALIQAKKIEIQSKNRNTEICILKKGESKSLETETV